LFTLHAKLIVKVKIFALLSLFFFLSFNLQANNCLRAILSTEEIRDLEKKIFSLKMNIQEINHLQLPTRPFAKREALRVFMFDKFGATWIDEGSILLKKITSGEKLRSELTEEERLLADGAFLFKSLDLVFTRIDYADEKQKFHTSTHEAEILALEATIDWFTENPHRTPPTDLMQGNQIYLKKLEDIEKSRSNLEQHEQDSVQSTEELKAIRYHSFQRAREAIGYYPYNVQRAWQELGYSETPYQE
jgi:hypothetical protein